MELISALIDLLKNPADAIASWINTLGMWAYLPIFIIIFIETGLVVMPFLPGDSLLFAAGIFSNEGKGFYLPILLGLAWTAAILGDQCNFAIGHFFGKRIIASGKVKALTPERITETKQFLTKWGPLAVFLGRFFPFIRTFVPFFAGMGGMHWRNFLPWNVLGGITWSSLFILLGYFFGTIPFVQDNFELVIIAIVLISLIPVLVGIFKNLIKKRAK